MLPPHATAFARFSPVQARVVLSAVAILAVVLAGISLSPWRSGYADYPGQRPSDITLYRAEADRIQAGEPYYTVIASELRARGYPTRSVFNWRTPLPVWLLGVLPSPAWGKAMLGGLCLLVLLLGFALVADEAGVRQGLLLVVALSGALLLCVLGDAFVMPELWSGVLMALSVCCHGRAKPGAGLAAGIAALFVRELAAPYCLVAAVLALRGRRYREVAGWCVGLAAYAVFYGWHVHTVLGLQGPNELAHEHGWVRFGGAAFVISTAQVNAWLLLLPQWVTALYLALAMAGLASWPGAAGERIGLTVAAYVLAFGIVGQDFNQYWGSMFAPLLCFGVARAPWAVRDLWHAARNGGRRTAEGEEWAASV